jgi:hypothetical protein
MPLCHFRRLGDASPAGDWPGLPDLLHARTDFERLNLRFLEQPSQILQELVLSRGLGTAGGRHMVRVEFVKSELRLIASVHCKNTSSNDGIADVFDELSIALTKIQEKIGEPEHWYFLIDIAAKDASATLAEFDPYEPGDPFLGSRNCWQAFCPPFWKNASTNPQSRRRIIEWIGRLEETLGSVLN